ncbi:MAG TPA: cob(I)yrinic acid a,c-diamide adenosyltransferase [Acidobacteriota bacterium]|nr:cob(I)yrinic acid a,c-diamide adenosyltransferase [Acidobacteriota bacterium]
MGYIYLYTGTGGGKTANALGLALRSVGHDKNVVIIQFFKWRKDIGEYLIKDKLAPYYEIYQFGRPAWLGKEEKTEEFAGEKFKVESIKDSDKELAKQALKFASQIMTEKKPHLLVLDEINLAVHWKLLEVKTVLELLDKVPKETTVVMTGRYTPQELIDRADFVNIVQDVKMPKDFKLTEGIQY